MHGLGRLTPGVTNRRVYSQQKKKKKTAEWAGKDATAQFIPVRWCRGLPTYNCPSVGPDAARRTWKRGRRRLGKRERRRLGRWIHRPWMVTRASQPRRRAFCLVEHVNRVQTRANPSPSKHPHPPLRRSPAVGAHLTGRVRPTRTRLGDHHQTSVAERRINNARAAATLLLP